MSVPVAGTPPHAVSTSPGAAARALVDAVEQVVHGRRQVVELAVATMLAGGHLLIEDVPGSGKTTLARALANVLGGSFRRIQGTADLMPADITGSAVWEPARGTFTFVPGPVFANVVVVDELNRTPPRTQSALLEAMDEGAVTVDGVRHVLPDPFVLLATQNPYEQWGTFPLPEGQLDRFTALVHLGQNTTSVEQLVVREQLAGATVDELEQVMPTGNVVAMRDAVRRVHVADAVLGYAVALTAATRSDPAVAIGASTRATIALVRCAQAHTLLADRPHVLPDDIKELAVAVLAHRLVMAAPDPDGQLANGAVMRAMAATPVPLSGA
ncbi:MAG TPA: MoxR family ATPase [Mycobacteriales bacterium]|nr:MoxR family ATPase [Mycobacteriales bacterium]